MSILIVDSIKNGALDENFDVKPNIDDNYGPYASTTEANSKIPTDDRAIGLTVGVKTGVTIKEYWYNGGTKDSNLIEKGGGGGGGSMELILDENVEDTTTYLNSKHPSASVGSFVTDTIKGGVYLKYDENSWIKLNGTILTNALPNVATVTGANMQAYK